MSTISLINGPNLNALGKRPAEIYGSETFEQIVSKVKVASEKLGLTLDSFQSNSEGELIDYIQSMKVRRLLLILELIRIQV